MPRKQCFNVYRIIDADVECPSKARGIVVIADSVGEAKSIAGKHKGRRVRARKIGFSCKEKGITNEWTR